MPNFMAEHCSELICLIHHIHETREEKNMAPGTCKGIHIIATNHVKPEWEGFRIKGSYQVMAQVIHVFIDKGILHEGKLPSHGLQKLGTGDRFFFDYEQDLGEIRLGPHDTDIPGPLCFGVHVDNSPILIESDLPPGERADLLYAETSFEQDCNECPVPRVEAGIQHASNADRVVLRPDDDVVVVAQKIFSKAEKRIFRLKDVVPTKRAEELSRITGKDPRFVELVLR